MKFFLIKYNIEYIRQDIRPTKYVYQTVVANGKAYARSSKAREIALVEVMANVVYTLNRYPMKVLRSFTPKETWSGRKLSIAHMRASGNIAYAMVPDEKRGKLDVIENKFMFLECSEGMKAYMFICLETKQIIKLETHCLWKIV